MLGIRIKVKYPKYYNWADWAVWQVLKISAVLLDALIRGLSIEKL